jgi:hypothetical protein
VPSGYTGDNSDCQNGDPLGGSCTITNTLRSAQFTVHKDFSDNNTASVQVTLECGSATVSPSGAQSVSEGSPVTFTVSGFSGDPNCTATESPIPTGYDSTGTCQAALSVGKCTIFNTLRSADFVVMKDFIPDSGDSVSVSLNCDSGQVTVVDGSASEADPAEFNVTGYKGDPNCTAIESLIPAGYDSTGTCQGKLLADGDCTITNTRLPTLTVEKVLAPSTDSGRFDLQIDGTTKKADAGDGDSTGAVVVSIGQHTVGEAAGSGTDLSDYSSEIGGDCGSDGKITLVAGDEKTCTITNTLRSEEFVVHKDFTPDSGASVSVSLTCSDGTVVTTPLQASEGSPAVFTVTGYTGDPTCTATETVPLGWSPDQSDCLNVDLVSDGICTIVNSFVPPPPTPTPTSTPPPPPTPTVTIPTPTPTPSMTPVILPTAAAPTPTVAPSPSPTVAPPPSPTVAPPLPTAVPPTPAELPPTGGSGLTPSTTAWPALAFLAGAMVLMLAGVGSAAWALRWRNR